jgi:Outer membrane lipoprotein carrier protein LolA-like
MEPEFVKGGAASNRRRFCLAALSVVTLGAAGLGPAAGGAFGQTGFDLLQLMQTLAKKRSGEARFTERRHVAIFDQPLVSSGRLWFEAPDTFVRETLEPRRERISVIGNQLTLTQGSRTRSIALDATPEAAVIVEAIRATLTGNRDALERHFKTNVAGDTRQWRLELVPRDARLQGQVSTIRLIGFGSEVREVQVWLADGDRSVMNIDPVVPSAAAPSASGAAAAAPSPR